MTSVARLGDRTQGQASVEAVAVMLVVAALAAGALGVIGRRGDVGGALRGLAAAQDAPAEPVVAPVSPGASLLIAPDTVGGPLAVAERLLSLRIREEPDGSNDGPAVRVFTDGHAEQWCADFVSYVLREGGRPFTGGASGGWRIAGTAAVRDWFRARGRYVERAAARPAPGDVVYFARNDGHVGIVRAVSVDGEVISTIEGNSSNRVAARTYAAWRGNPEIGGFGRP